MAHPLGWVLWHRSAKFMTIDLWYIGVLLRLLQILVILYFILTTAGSGAWAYSETPRANINARVTALIKMLWRHAAMLTSCIVFLTLWPSGRRTASSLGGVSA